jgi:hypothetical protein
MQNKGVHATGNNEGLLILLEGLYDMIGVVHSELDELKFEVFKK